MYGLQLYQYFPRRHWNRPFNLPNAFSTTMRHQLREKLNFMSASLKIIWSYQPFSKSIHWIIKRQLSSDIELSSDNIKRQFRMQKKDPSKHSWSNRNFPKTMNNTGLSKPPNKNIAEQGLTNSWRTIEW